jgi:transcriptional regulator with XRE-family HTH domain
MELNMAIGSRLRELRKARGLTQMDVARVSLLSLSIITQLEQGLTKDPKLSTLRGLAKTLGVSIDELVGPEDEPPAAALSSPPAPKPRKPKGGTR